MTPWTEHVSRWRDCKRCPLHAQRDQIVLARGDVPCDVLFIGEAPGESENALGQPFIGPAGKLLDAIIERSVDKSLRVALTNLVACFPADAKHAGINEPASREIEACRPRLSEFIDVCQPKLIVTVGGLAADWMPDTCGVPVVSVVHPAAILRMPLVQRSFAVQKSAVIIATALEDVVLLRLHA